MSSLVDAFYHPQQDKENRPPVLNKVEENDSDDEVCFNPKSNRSMIASEIVQNSPEQTFTSFSTPQKSVLPLMSPASKKKPVLIVEDSPESSPVSLKQPSKAQLTIPLSATVPQPQFSTPSRTVYTPDSSLEEESPICVFKKPSASTSGIVNSSFLSLSRIASSTSTAPLLAAPAPQRNKQEEKREQAATKIQCIFRRWIARKALRRLQEERSVVIQQKDAQLRIITLRSRAEIDVKALDERMLHLESEWLKKITALANVNAIFEQLAEAAGKKGPRTQQIEERKMKLALLKSARLQCKAKCDETAVPSRRSSFAPSTPGCAPPASTIAAPDAVSQKKKRVRWIDLESAMRP